MIPRPPTHRPSPHMVSRFPHTATRLTHFSIRFHRSSQAGHLPIRFPRIHHTIHRLQRIRPQIQRDQRPVSANHQPIPSRKFTEPATGLSGSTLQSNSLKFPAPARGTWAWRRFAMRRRRGPCIQARLKAGSCGADPRGTETGWTRQKSADAAPGQPDPHDGTRRPSARPGVTPALRRWGTVSLSF